MTTPASHLYHRVMVWGFNWLASPKLSEEEKAKERKRCSMFITALEGCRKAYPEAERELACKNLRQSVITCYAEKHAVPEAEEHRKCYTKLYKTGISHTGQGHCIPYEQAMQKALQKKGLFPV